MFRTATFHISVASYRCSHFLIQPKTTLYVRMRGIGRDRTSELNAVDSTGPLKMGSPLFALLTRLLSLLSSRYDIDWCR